MAPSRIRKAIGAVKDTTSIGLAKVSARSTTTTELEVAVVKATRHSTRPAEDKHAREIIALTCYSRHYISACVGIIARRLDRTSSWTVAVKALALVHRLLAEGDPKYEEEVFLATKSGGVRLLNMAEFRDRAAGAACSWDFSAFVRTFAMYIDETLQWKMSGSCGKEGCRWRVSEDEVRELVSSPAAVEEMSVEAVFEKIQRLQRVLERFLACRPTGAAKTSRVVAVALYPVLKESYTIYRDLADLTSSLLDRFTNLDIPDCVRARDAFASLSPQLDDLDAFYKWARSVGISRTSEAPNVERVAARHIQSMDDYIRDRSSSSSPLENRRLQHPEEEPGLGGGGERALLWLHKENEVVTDVKEEKRTAQAHWNELALALFDGDAFGDRSEWVAFSEEPTDWEATSVESGGAQHDMKLSLGGKLDSLKLDGTSGTSELTRRGSMEGGGNGGYQQLR